MNDNEKTVPYLAYELMQVKHERTVRRLIYALILSIFLIFASNAAWLYAWCQYDYISEDLTSEVNYVQDGRGINNINTGTQGDVMNEPEVDD